jgi:hypothetical protein
VADLDDRRSPLLLASLPESYDVDHDTYDGTHPNASGEHKITAAFAGAMHQAWGMGGEYGEDDPAGGDSTQHRSHHSSLRRSGRR